jgi:polysaccharide export outer membrane protein
LGYLVLLILCSSCGNTRQLTYLQGKFDTAQLSKIDLKEPVIKKGDLLSIIVYSDNPEATALFNQAQIGSSSSSGGNTGGTTSSAVTALGASGGSGITPGSGGYLVDETGNIEFQGLGVVHVEGMQRRELKDSLEQRLKEFLKDPYCTIRFLNYRFTMLGEISRPGVFNIPGEHINLLEALGLGGDLTFFGRRDNILIIRENNGHREFGRVDLTKPEVMASPYFNLQANDVVYIEANRKKIAATDQTAIRTITITTALISTFAILYEIFK